MSKKKPIIIIAGTTASGKTKLGIEMCKRFNGEVISADSMQIYREFNICTAKPDKTELESVNHYLIDIASVREEFSVARYVVEARKLIDYILDRDKFPVIVGGTGLYIDSLINNIKFEEDSGSSLMREELLNRARNGEADLLIKELREIDPESADKIHPNDKKRIVRAVEFYRTYGYPISMQSRKDSKAHLSPYETCMIVLGFKNREILYNEINNRVDQMIDKGLIEECREIMKFNVSKTAGGAIGYKETIPFLLGRETFEEAIENIKRETRRYAKRQITWFKRRKDSGLFYVDEYKDFDETADTLEKYILESSAFKLWSERVRY